MEDIHWQLVLYLFFLASPFFWLLFLLKVFCTYGRKYWITLAIYSSPLLFLHCHTHIAWSFTLLSDWTVKYILLTCLGSIATKMSLVKTVGHELQRRTLCDTSRNVELECCIVPSVPISPLLPTMICRYVQMYTSLSRASKILRFRLTWKHPKWFSHRNNECWTWRYHQRRGWYECQRGVAFMSTVPHRFLIWTEETQSIQLCNRKLQRNNSRWQDWSLLSINLNSAAKVNLVFGLIPKIINDGGLR